MGFGFNVSLHEKNDFLAEIIDWDWKPEFHALQRGTFHMDAAKGVFVEFENCSVVAGYSQIGFKTDSERGNKIRVFACDVFVCGEIVFGIFEDEY